MSSKITANVLRAKVGGPIEASTYFTYKSLFKDTYFISEPQTIFTKWPLFCARTMTESARLLLLAVIGWR
jgi:hypothetical protein